MENSDRPRFDPRHLFTFPGSLWLILGLCSLGSGAAAQDGPASAGLASADPAPVEASAEDAGRRAGTAPNSASGISLGGRWGLGTDSLVSVQFEGQLLDLPCISVRYRPLDRLGVQMLLGVAVSTEEADSGVGRSLGLRLIYDLLRWERTRLGFVLGGALSGFTLETEAADTPDNPAIIEGHTNGFELGVRPEFFLGEHLSIHTQLGLYFANGWIEQTPAGGDPDEAPRRALLRAGMAADLLGQAGLSVWF